MPCQSVLRCQRMGRCLDDTKFEGRSSNPLQYLLWDPKCQLGFHEVVAMGFQLSNKASFSLVLGLSLVQQAHPSLLVGDHPHLGFESTPSHQVVSRPTWGHTGSSGVILKKPQNQVKVDQHLGSWRYYGTCVIY